MSASALFLLGPLALSAFAFGCGGVKPGPTSKAPAPGECSATLQPRTGPVELIAAEPARPAALSHIVVHGEMPLGTLRDQLQNRLPQRLAEGRFGIGPAGRVGYSVERGDIAFSVVKNQLIAQAPVHARAAACRGDNCYASCEPEAVVTAQVSLLLRPDYGFEPAKVGLRFTRGCQVATLGGFLTLDVTPTLANELEPVLARVASQIDAQLYDFRDDMQRGWHELSTPRDLPLGGCLVLQPQSIAQGALTDSNAVVDAQFAVLARPELRTTCVDLPSPSPLPALERDLSMPDEGRVTLGLVTALHELESAFASAQAVALAKGELFVVERRLRAFGSDIVAELTLGGALCGELAFAATPSFAADGAFIGLARPRWQPGDRERVAAQGFDPDHLLQALAAIPRLPPLLSVAAVQSAAPAMAKMLSTADVEFSAKVSSTRGAGAVARDSQLVAWVEMLGRLDVKVASVPKLHSH